MQFSYASWKTLLYFLRDVVLLTIFFAARFQPRIRAGIRERFQSRFPPRIRAGAPPTIRPTFRSGIGDLTEAAGHLTLAAADTTDAHDEVEGTVRMVAGSHERRTYAVAGDSLQSRGRRAARCVQLRGRRGRRDHGVQPGVGTRIRTGTAASHGGDAAACGRPRSCGVGVGARSGTPHGDRDTPRRAARASMRLHTQAGATGQVDWTRTRRDVARSCDGGVGADSRRSGGPPDPASYRRLTLAGVAELTDRRAHDPGAVAVDPGRLYPDGHDEITCEAMACSTAAAPLARCCSHSRSVRLSAASIASVTASKTTWTAFSAVRCTSRVGSLGAAGQWSVVR